MPKDATPLVPRYGERTLAEVVPSLLAGLGCSGFANPLGVPAVHGGCLLLVDGLGWDLLRAHPQDAPFLAAQVAGTEPLTVGFPATTATSLASVGTGVPPGRHGIVGYSFAPGREDRLLNALTWREHGLPQPAELLDVVVPEETQPLPTVWQRAAEAGVQVSIAAPRMQRRSGLTRAVLRGGRFLGTYALGDLAATAVDSLHRPGPTLIYAYHGDLDLLGHVYGPGSLPWRMQLRQVDRLAASIAEQLPADTVLAVVADHGMVQLDRQALLDADKTPELRAGVRSLGGEVRARHVYARAGAGADVRAAWQELLGAGAWVLGGDEAVAAGWFGPEVSTRVRPRIGDVVMAARGRGAVICSVAEPKTSRLVGQHGSLTAAEQEVPFLLVAGASGVPNRRQHQAYRDAHQ